MSAMYNHEYCKLNREFNTSIEADDIEEDEIANIDIECMQSEKVGDELLIDLVRSRPFLYDKSLQEYRDPSMKENAWTEISSVMNMSASECQTRWVRLRQRFSKERQQRELETRSGAGKPTRQKWFLFDNLNFLSRVVFQRKSLSNVGTKVNMNQNVQNECYQDDINITPAASMVLQAPVCSPLQQSTPSPLQQLTTSQLQQPPSPMLRSMRIRQRQTKDRWQHRDADLTSD